MLPQVNLPYYDLTLPSNGKTIKFRPFIMKEEKVLLMALEDGKELTMLNAIHDVVSDCTNGTLDTNISPLFDVQYAFLQIRSKSVGETVDFVVRCGECDSKQPMVVDIAKIEVERIEGHTNKIQLTDSLGVIMKYPTIKHLDILTNYKKTEDVYTVIADCIDQIFDKEEVYSTATETQANILTWIDNLPVTQFNKIQEFFRTMPVLRYVKPFKCGKCQKDNVLTLEGIESFFV